MKSSKKFVLDKEKEYRAIYDAERDLYSLQTILKDDKPLQVSCIDSDSTFELEDGDVIYVKLVKDKNEANLYRCKIDSNELIRAISDREAKRAEFEKNRLVKSAQVRLLLKRLDEAKDQYSISKNDIYDYSVLKHDNRYQLLTGVLSDKFGFEGFYHYTTLENFINILSTGKLYSRNHKKNDTYKDAALQSAIDITEDIVLNSVRFYYKGKTPTFYNNEGIKKHEEGTDNPHMPIPVAMLFEPKIARKSGCNYIEGSGKNLISNDEVISRYTSDPIAARETFNWDLIFSRGFYGEYRKFLNAEEQNAPKWKGLITNYRNSEFLYPNELKVNGTMKQVFFRCPADRRTAISIFGRNDMFCVDESEDRFYRHKAKAEINYLYEYRVVVQAKELKVTLSYYSDFREYRNELYYVDSDGKLEYIDLNEKANGIVHMQKTITVFIKKNNIKRMVVFMNGYLSAHWEKK